MRAAASTSPRPARAPSSRGSSRSRPPRCAPGAAPTTWRETLSPSRPLSRKRKADSGEITYGGLEVTSSKRSPAAGSKKLPARHSTFSTPLSAALNAANRSARSLMSVATTCPLCREARIAWIPEPGAHVERGLDRPAHGQVRERQRRAVHSGDVVRRLLVAASARRSEAIRISSCGTIRTSGVTSAPSDSTTPSCRARSSGSDANARSASAIVDRELEHEEPHERADRPDARQPPRVDGDVRAPREQLAADAERLADALAGQARPRAAPRRAPRSRRGLRAGAGRGSRRSDLRSPQANSRRPAAHCRSGRVRS